MRIRALVRFMIAIMLICVIIATTGCEAYYDRKLDEMTLESVQEFDISQDEYYMERIANPEDLDIYLGAIESPKDLMENGEALWIQMYGEESIKPDRPYYIYYDKKADIWLMYGEPGYEIQPIKRWIDSIEEKLHHPIILGGIEYIIVQGSDGKVLAVWREF